MNRRKLIKYGLCAPAVTLPVGVLAVETRDYETLYWEAQTKIDTLEEEVQELRSHARVLQMNRAYSK